MTDKPSICVISRNAYGMVSGSTSGFIGGAEKQATVLARWLAEKSYPVTVITWDEGGPPEERFGDVRVLKTCRQDAGMPGLRFLYPRWNSLVQAMRRADARLYYHNCSETETGQIAMWCRLNHRRFVYSLASDTGCDPGLSHLRTGRERLLYRYGLRHADRIIVQTNKQRDQLRGGFGLDSEVIRMPCGGVSDRPFQPRCGAPSNRILWIGRVCRAKRPDRLFEIARSCPDLRFDLVGPVYDDAYSRGVRNRAMSIPNLVFHGRVSKSQVCCFYDKAACLCSTSDTEGFPNTFLEAWSFGLPVVSLFDPDDVISTYRLGVAARNTGKLIAGVRHLVVDAAYYKEASRNALSYYWREHRPEVVLPQFERALLSALSGKSL